eukprot:1372691-Amphidinium_carterae.1
MRVLEALDAPPAENVTARVYVLLRTGCPRDQIKDAIKLMGEVVWSPALTEKQHSGVIVIRRDGPNSLCSVVEGFCISIASFCPKLQMRRCNLGNGRSSFESCSLKRQDELTLPFLGSTDHDHGQTVLLVCDNQGCAWKGFAVFQEQLPQCSLRRFHVQQHPDVEM